MFVFWDLRFVIYPSEARPVLKRYILLALLLFFSINLSYCAGENKILLLKLEGVINTASSELVKKAVMQAEEGYSLLIIELNTEGGLAKSMRKIVEEIRGSTLPVVVYVSPKGAQAASAGVFIALAADVNAMAPSTNIGAAHPVNIGGKMDEEMDKKITNDAASFIRSIAEETNHNPDWAEEAVRESVSLSAKEAKSKGVVDILAEDLEDLLRQLEWRRIEKSGRQWILRTEQSIVEEFVIGIKDRFLHILGNPNIAYLLLMVGIWGLILEFSHPGSLLPGTVGSICLILGLYALHTLPLNYAGLGLIILGIILFVLETQTPTNGILTIGGVISLGIGSFMLIGGEARYISLSIPLILTVVGITVAFFIFIISFAIKAQFRKVITGEEGLLNQEGYAKTNIGAKGVVYVVGEYWSARSEDGKRIKKGGRIEVIKKEGRVLVVRRKEKSQKEE